ncbi:helix-turn-helix domain-containing GNAT family N-acetyltransferase [Demequina sp. NBRC 110056]|uniref:bifunctional helix-turn-helix transcriptional regulator/GNAT family N-acetyltransferase n=1 Tax=Demequina sp. NBRC 110056 TaxID=1570345 RepID=UPI0009FFC539|nr:helix-turn-helix domain-containing GNAT family N-acetyltransferase [Demequina sp. NBRC 110056]
MDDRLIQTFRVFQRTVTREVGALQENFLGRGRPYGVSRLLWEMGDGPVEVATLRERLGLDAGYASRLLRALEDEGLVTVSPSPDDARARVAERTEAGRAEAAELDARSDDTAAQMLAHLDEEERREVERAARTVTAALARRHLVIDVEAPDSADAWWCRDQYFAEIDAIFASGYDPAAAVQATDDDLTMPRGALLVARLHGQPVGCGAVKLPAEGPAHLKRMWVSPAARGLGLAATMLERLEAIARDAGATEVGLDTNSALVAATTLYESRGYAQVPRFNDETHADRWYLKRLEQR